MEIDFFLEDGNISINLYGENSSQKVVDEVANKVCDALRKCGFIIRETTRKEVQREPINLGNSP